MKPVHPRVIINSSVPKSNSKQKFISEPELMKTEWVNLIIIMVNIIIFLGARKGQSFFNTEHHVFKLCSVAVLSWKLVP